MFRECENKPNQRKYQIQFIHHQRLDINMNHPSLFAKSLHFSLCLRLPSILPKEIKPPPLEAKHSYVPSAHNKSLHSIIMAPVTQSETDIR